MKHFFLAAGLLLLAGCSTSQTRIAESDISLMEQALQLALEIDPNGQGRSWVNPETGHSGIITPVVTYVGEPGVFCRDYEDTQVVGDRRTTYQSRACRAQASHWVWVEDVAPLPRP